LLTLPTELLARLGDPLGGGLIAERLLLLTTKPHHAQRAVGLVHVRVPALVANADHRIVISAPSDLAHALQRHGRGPVVLTLAPLVNLRAERVGAGDRPPLAVPGNRTRTDHPRLDTLSLDWDRYLLNPRCPAGGCLVGQVVEALFDQLDVTLDPWLAP